MDTPPDPPQTPTKKDPRRWIVFAAALMPFIAASLYMSLKPVPKRIPRTHGGSAGIPYVETQAGQTPPP